MRPKLSAICDICGKPRGGFSKVNHAQCSQIRKHRAELKERTKKAEKYSDRKTNFLLRGAFNE